MSELVDPAAAAVIEGYLDALSRSVALPRRVAALRLEEIRETLVDLTLARRARGEDELKACEQSVLEFGDPDDLGAALTRELSAAASKSTARLLGYACALVAVAELLVALVLHQRMGALHISDVIAEMSTWCELVVVAAVARHTAEAARRCLASAPTARRLSALTIAAVGLLALACLTAAGVVGDVVTDDRAYAVWPLTGAGACLGGGLAALFAPRLAVLARAWLAIGRKSLPAPTS